MADQPPEPAAALDVTGSLRIESADHAFDVVAQGERVLVNLPSVGALTSLLQAPGDRSQLNQLTALLARHDVDVVIQLKGEPVATLGRSADTGTLEKMLSLEGVDVRLRDLAKALFKRKGD